MVEAFCVVPKREGKGGGKEEGTKKEDKKKKKWLM